MKVMVIHHSADADGWASGALLAHLATAIGASKFDITFCGYNYNNKFDMTELVGIDLILCGDISLPVDTVNEILDMGIIFMWFDHHHTAIESYKEAGLFDRENFHAECTEEFAGCQIIYKFMERNFPESIVCPELTEKVIHYIGEWDVWRHDDPNTELFHLALFGYYTWPNLENIFGVDGFWTNLIPWSSSNENNQDILNALIDEGSVVRSYQQTLLKKLGKVYCGDIHFEGLTLASCNTILFGSKACDHYVQPYHDAILTYQWNGKYKSWNIAMYSNPKSSKDIDLSEIAKKYGGGGHKTACGFSADVLPFEVK